MRALALFSGGLDSILAMKVMQEQGIEIIPIHFVSHFFGGKNERAENMVKQLNLTLEYVDFSKAHTKILKNPVHGRGKNMNPCIDCHALMFKVAGELLEKYEASFLISGEVLGQRPMSQNYQALEKVKSLTQNLENLIVRPLSAKLLPESEPEKLKWIDRELLLDIEGRSRKRQMELAEKYNIVDYPTPGGGCLLTDPAYSKRLKILEGDDHLEEKFSHLFHLLKIGRFFRIDIGKYIIVGRNEDDNEKLENFSNKVDLFIKSDLIPGPSIAGIGHFNDDDVKFALELFSRYSKIKGSAKVIVSLNDQNTLVPIINLDEVEDKIKKYQINL